MIQPKINLSSNYIMATAKFAFMTLTFYCAMASDSPNDDTLLTTG
jgi:hypothetical protein